MRELNISPTLLETNVNLRELENVDSLNLVRIIARIEERFDVELDDSLVFSVTAIDDLVQSVNALCVSARGAAE